MKYKEDFDDCICDNYDGKGKSTCGFPCDVHKPSKKRKLPLKLPLNTWDTEEGRLIAIAHNTLLDYLGKDK